MKKEISRPTFSGRLIIVGIVFLVPITVLFYWVVVRNEGFLFMQSQVSGYVVFIVFLLVYIVLIKLATWILSLMGIKWK